MLLCYCTRCRFLNTPLWECSRSCVIRSSATPQQYNTNQFLTVIAHISLRACPEQPSPALIALHCAQAFALPPIPLVSKRTFGRIKTCMPAYNLDKNPYPFVDVITGYAPSKTSSLMPLVARPFDVNNILKVAVNQLHVVAYIVSSL